MRLLHVPIVLTLSLSALPLGVVSAQHRAPYVHALPWEVSLWFPAWGGATAAELEVARLAPVVDHADISLDRIMLLGRRALVVEGSTSTDRNRWRRELFVYLLDKPAPRLVWHGVQSVSAYEVPPEERHGFSSCLYVVSDSTLEYQLYLHADSVVWPRYARALEATGRYDWSPQAERFVRTGPVSRDLQQACEQSGERNPD
jgi:hypothetical protein